jgi:DNA primase
MISDATLDRIREATDVVELISAYVKLRKRGQHFVGLCPFHTEKTPSFSVNRERRIFHCFGCGRGGDVFRFLMDHERMGFVEAVSYLAERAHLELPRGEEGPSEAGSRLQEALARAVEYFDKALAHGPTGARAREYLLQRRVSPEWAARFALGYAPDKSRGLITYAARFGVTVADLEAAGLLVAGRVRSSDRFRDRLMFPVRTVSGKPIAFGGRDLSGKSPAKYINSPETALYQKGRVLYGLYEARTHLQQAGTAILCEGYFDLLRLHEHGFGHAVAVSGTALSSEQARLLARYASLVVLLFDADSAGQKAALRSVPLFFEAGLDVRIASLPGGQDPDLFLQEAGAEALAQRLQQAVSFVEFLESQAGAPFAKLTPAAQDRFIQEVARVAALMTDPVRQDLLIQSAWSKAGIPEEHIRARLAAASKQERPTPPPSRRLEKHDWREELLCLLISRPELRVQAKREILPEDFESPLQRQLLTTLLTEDYLKDSPDRLRARKLEPGLHSELSRLAALPLEFETAESSLAAYLLKAKRQRLLGAAKKLVEEMAAAERRGDASAAADLSAQHMAVRGEWIRLGKGQPRDEDLA